MAANKKKKTSGVNPIQWVLVIVLFAALITVLILLLNGNDAAPADAPNPAETDAPVVATGRLPAGVTINGVDVGGMNAAEARSALTSSVTAQLDGVSITLTDGSYEWVMDSTQVEFTTDLEEVISTAVAANAPASYNTAVTADENDVLSFMSVVSVDVNYAATEPSVVYDPTSTPPFTVTGGEPGLSLDAAATTQAVMTQLKSGVFSKVQIVATEVAPRTSADDVLQTTALISSFSTEFSTSNKNRTYNLQLACEKLNGYAIQPGATFSFNEVVGNRNEANGWKQANVLVGGVRYEEDWGGGICQPSTTLYNALLLTGADFTGIVERTHHSIPSDYVARGLDATVAYGSKDFKFTNLGDSTIYVIMYLSNTEERTGVIHVDLYGKALPDGVTYEVTSEIDETIDPPAPEYIEDPTEPTTYKHTQIAERKGYVVSVYRQKLVNGEPEGEREKLYTDKYNAVQGVYNIGTAGVTDAGDDGDDGEVVIPDDEPTVDDSFIPEE